MGPRQLDVSVSGRGRNIATTLFGSPFRRASTGPAADGGTANPFNDTNSGCSEATADLSWDRLSGAFAWIHLLYRRDQSERENIRIDPSISIHRCLCDQTLSKDLQTQLKVRREFSRYDQFAFRMTADRR